MALSIKTAEADELARSLAQLTGETMTQAVTVALRERLARETRLRATDGNYVERLLSFSASLRGNYETRPVTREEWDAASGDET